AECGLVAVPARSAILLTTSSRHRSAIREPLSEPLERAIAAAVTWGQDSSGRFRSALDWLRPENSPTTAATPAPLLGFAADPADWNEWEPVDGLTTDRLIVVRRDGVMGLGLGLTLLLVLFFWLIRRGSVRWRRTFLFMTLGLAGLGVLWLPNALRNLAWWPLLAGCGGAGVWYLKAVTHSTRNPKTQIRKLKSVVANPATAVVLLLAVFGWNGRAAAPAPIVVYLVAESADAPENQTVLAPADLLDRLKALARPTPLVAGGPQAVLLDASYEGKLVDNQAEFAAVFSVQCLS